MESGSSVNTPTWLGFIKKSTEGHWIYPVRTEIDDIIIRVKDCVDPLPEVFDGAVPCVHPITTYPSIRVVEEEIFEQTI